MKCSSDSLDGGDDPRAPIPAPGAADTGSGSSNEPSKRQRTEEPSASSSGAGECSSSSPRAAPLQAPPPGGEEQARVPDLGEDLVFEVLMRAEARTLASAECVSRAWRQLARDERLWEEACAREWVSLGFAQQTLRWSVLRHGGFRNLYRDYIRPFLQRRPAGARGRQVPPRLHRDQVQVLLGMQSASFFMNMPKVPLKKEDKDNDKNGGGKCG